MERAMTWMDIGQKGVLIPSLMNAMGSTMLPHGSPMAPHDPATDPPWPTGAPHGAPVGLHGTFMAPLEAPVDPPMALLGNPMAHIRWLAITFPKNPR